MVKPTNKPIVANSRNPEQGYTVLELMVVVAIVAILAAGTVPGLKDSIERNARESAMQNLITAIGVARSEAVTQGRNVSICRSTNQATCAATTGSDWDDGWIVFTDGGTAGILDGAGASADVLARVYGPSNDLSVITLKPYSASGATAGTITGDFLQFNSSGFMNINTAGVYFKFCSKDNVATKTRAILLSLTGRPTLSATVSVANGGVQKDLQGVALVCP